MTLLVSGYFNQACTDNARGVVASLRRGAQAPPVVTLASSAADSGSEPSAPDESAARGTDGAVNQTEGAVSHWVGDAGDSGGSVAWLGSEAAAAVSVQVVEIEVCGPGTFVQGDRSTQVCAPCDGGTFSSGINWPECLPWTACGWAPLVEAGSAETDAVCEVGRRVVQFGSREVDSVTDVAVGPDGHVYLAGVVDADFPGFSRLEGWASRFVVRLSETGELQPVWYLGGDGGPYLWYWYRPNVELVNLGSRLLAVWMETDDIDAPQEVLATDLSADGSQGTETRIVIEPPSATPEARLELGSVVALPEGDLIVGGSYHDRFGDPCVSGVVIRLDLDGELIWREEFGFEGTCVQWNTAFQRNGLVYIAGNVERDGGTYGIVEVVTAEGELLSTKTFAPEDGQLHDVAIADNQDWVVALSTGVDATVQKWSAAGDLLWSKTLHGAYVRPRLALAGAGGVWVTGGTDWVRTTTGYDGLVSHYGTLDAYLERLDENGETLWLSQFGSAGNEVGRAVVVSGDEVFVAGETNGVMGSAVGQMDGFVVQVIEPR